MPTTVSNLTAENRTGESTDTRTQILDCAEGRFRTFGYGKTTMAEIAGDARMSAANLYRYFDNKQELGVACAKRCIEEMFQALRIVIRQQDAPASTLLMTFVVEIVRWTHETTAEQPRVHELVEMITRERHEVVRWRDSRICGLIAEILARGNDSGEFDVDDVISTAATIHAALSMFQLPLFVGLYSMEELELKAKNVAQLLLQGLLVK